MKYAPIPASRILPTRLLGEKRECTRCGREMVRRNDRDPLNGWCQDCIAVESMPVPDDWELLDSARRAPDGFDQFDQVTATGLS